MADMMKLAAFTNMTQHTEALMEAVVEANLRALQELLHATDPDAVLELQRRFIREYTAVLMQGTMTLLGTIEAAAAGGNVVKAPTA